MLARAATSVCGLIGFAFAAAAETTSTSRSGAEITTNERNARFIALTSL
jgi:hypothetical protein